MDRRSPTLGRLPGVIVPVGILLEDTADISLLSWRCGCTSRRKQRQGADEDCRKELLPRGRWDHMSWGSCSGRNVVTLDGLVVAGAARRTAAGRLRRNVAWVNGVAVWSSIRSG